MCLHSKTGGHTQEGECSKIQGGILDKGLRTSIVALSENTRDLLVEFRKTNKTKEDKSKTMNSRKFRDTE